MPFGPIQQVEVVLFGLDFDISYTKFSKAMQYLDKGAVFLATNDDHTFPLRTKKAIGMKEKVAYFGMGFDDTPIFFTVHYTFAQPRVTRKSREIRPIKSMYRTNIYPR